MKKIVTLLSFGFLLTFIGCNKQLVEDPVGSSTDFTFKVEAADASNGSPETRSSFASNLQNKITDFSIFVFDAEGTFVSKNYYAGSDNMKGRDLFINDELGTTFDDEFVVYIIANLGDLRNNSALCTNGIPAYNKIENYSYSFSNNFSEFNNKGFPMAGYYESYCPSTDSRTLYANKIVTQYNIRFTKSSSNNNTYTITGGKLANVANMCTPFKTFIASASQTTSNGDSFTSSDISALNSGNYAALFVLENEQGTVFSSDITEENEKKLENLSMTYRSRCSYVEFYVNVQTPTATYENVIYRYFFGDNVRDCSIHRNMVYDLTMNFDNVFVEDEGWRIEPGEPIVDRDCLAFSKNSSLIIKGYNDTISVWHNNGSTPIDYTLRLGNSASSYGLVANRISTGNDYDRYVIKTTYNTGRISSPNSANTVSVPITICSLDGLIEKTLNVSIITDALYLKFSYDGKLGFDGYNPFNLQYEIGVSGRIQYACAYLPHGTIKGSTLTYTSSYEDYSFYDSRTNKTVYHENETGHTAFQYCLPCGPYRNSSGGGGTWYGFSYLSHKSEHEHHHTWLGTDENYRADLIEGFTLNATACFEDYPDIPIACANSSLSSIGLYQSFSNLNGCTSVVGFDEVEHSCSQNATINIPIPVHSSSSVTLHGTTFNNTFSFSNCRRRY